MAQPSDLEARVAALETQVQELQELAGRVRASEQDAAAARVLAGGADRDVAQIRDEIRDFRRATTASFNAMREDLGDLRTELDNGFTEMRGKFDAAAAGQQQIADLLNTLTQQGGQPGDRSPGARMTREWARPDACPERGRRGRTGAPPCVRQLIGFR